MMSIKAIEKKMQFDNTLLVRGQNTLADSKKKKQTKAVGNQLIHKMDIIGIPRGTNWITREQVKVDLATGKIHDNNADDDFGQYDEEDTKKALKDPDNKFFELWTDGGGDPYFEECNGVTAIPIYGDYIDPDTSRADTGNDYINTTYEMYLDKLKDSLKSLAIEKHILQKTNDVHGYAKKLINNKKRANAEVKKAKVHAKKVALSANSQLDVIKKMD